MARPGRRGAPFRLTFAGKVAAFVCFLVCVYLLVVVVRFLPLFTTPLTGSNDGQGVNSADQAAVADLRAQLADCKGKLEAIQAGRRAASSGGDVWTAPPPKPAARLRGQANPAAPASQAAPAAPATAPSAPVSSTSPETAPAQPGPAAPAPLAPSAVWDSVPKGRAPQAPVQAPEPATSPPPATPAAPAPSVEPVKALLPADVERQNFIRVRETLHRLCRDDRC